MEQNQIAPGGLPDARTSGNPAGPSADSQSNTLSAAGRTGSAFLRQRLRRWICVGLLVATTGVQAQPAPSASGEQEQPSVQQLQERLQSLEAATGIDEQLRKRLLELYQVAIERRTAAESYANTTRELEQLVRTAPQQIRQLEQETAAIAPPVPVAESEFAAADLDRLHQVLAQEKATLAGLQSQFADAESQLRQARARPARARSELAEAKVRREEIERELQALGSATDNERLLQARRAALQAQRQAAINQIRMLEQELLSSDTRIALLDARRALAQRRTEVQAARVAGLEQLANERSRAEAAQSAQQAAQAAVGAQPVVREAAATNAALSDQLAMLVSQLEEAAATEQRVERRLDQLQARAQTTEQQLEIAGLSSALGDLLRRERRALPSVSQVASRVRERQQLIAELRLRQFQIEQERQEADSVERQVAQLLAQRLPEVDPAQAPEIAVRLRQLLIDRADLRQKLSINYGRYADQLLELNRVEQLLVAQTLAYQELLDESLFWIASGKPVGWSWLRDIAHSLGWLLRPAHWAEVADTFAARVRNTPIVFGGSVLLFALLLGGRGALRRELIATTVPVGTDADTLRLTVKALWYTLLLALPWPLLLGALGSLLASGTDPASLPHAVGLALRSSALVVLIIEGFRQLCRDRGVAQVHFRWRLASRRGLRRHLSWLLAVAVPVGFLITLTESQPDEIHRDSLGRLAFVVGSLALALFAWLILRPRFRLTRRLGRERRRGWWRIRRTLRLVAAAAPLSLAALALYGYYYTALQLESRLVSTGWLVVGLVIVGNVVYRWLRLAEHRLTGVPQAGDKRRAEVDVAAVDDQSRTVFAAAVTVVAVGGLWLIWSDLLPALNILENLVLWEATGSEAEPLIRVTVGDVLLAVAMLGLMAIAAKNLPGLLEITVLHRLAVDPGNRYAITTISRYLIVAIGLIVALTYLGVRWTQAQWLIAALGVGLGFGLQEIFANFVSGLILLFERPIRVGDTVTVGDLSGQVSRIRIRATTITDWDRRELIIPNKMFITDRLINWTLSDQVSRLVIKVGLPLGTPPDTVQRLLLACAHDNPRVMHEPAPFAYFVGLGDGTQNFELVVFVAQLADRLPVRHELYSEVLRRLADAGIEIPLPPRALHIRGMPDRDPPRGS